MGGSGEVVKGVELVAVTEVLGLDLVEVASDAAVSNRIVAAMETLRAG
jgi:hypothetical protein